MGTHRLKNVILFVQARSNSLRFPNKIFKKLHGNSIIEWIIHRLSILKKVDDVIYLIPDNNNNDKLNNVLEKNKVKIYRGNEDNVLKRFYDAAVLFNASHIVRVCADNPLVLAAEIDLLVDKYFNNDCDYMYNHIPLKNNYPDGLGGEIISFELLKHIYINAKSDFHLEHCFSYIHDNSNEFAIKTFNPLKKNRYRPDLKFDVDKQKDLDFLNSKRFDINVDFDELINLFG